MRLSLVEDYDDKDDQSSLSQDSVDIAPTKQKQTASYTNLFDTSSQTTPVGAAYQQTQQSPRMARPKDLYDRSPRAKPVPRLQDKYGGPPLATPEVFSPIGSPRSQARRLNLNSPQSDRTKPPSGQNRLPLSHRGNQNFQQGASYPSQSNNYNIRSASEERFRDNTRQYETSSNMYNQYPDPRTRRSQENLNERGQGHVMYKTRTSKTLPNQNRGANNISSNQTKYGNKMEDGADGDYKRPMSFVKALEMTEIMQAKDRNQQEKNALEEKKKSVYDATFEISV